MATEVLTSTPPSFGSDPNASSGRNRNRFRNCRVYNQNNKVLWATGNIANKKPYSGKLGLSKDGGLYIYIQNARFGPYLNPWSTVNYPEAQYLKM